MVRPSDSDSNAERPLEIGVVLAAARSRLPAAEVGRLRNLVRAGPDWDAVLRAARRHEVFPLLGHSLKTLGAGAVPAPVLHRLQEWSFATAARNLFLTGELLRLLDRLGKEGVLAVPFKGPVLAAAAYGSPALRSFADLDILVDVRDVPRAQSLLEREGYRPRLPRAGLRRLAYLQSECSSDYLREDGRATVELHWGLMPRYFGFPLRLADVRGRLTSVSLGAAAVPSLAAEDLLLFLCLHGTKHRWASLKWICDVAELVGSPEALDWGVVTRRAGALGGERMLRLGLLLAADLLGARPPEGAGPPPADRAVRALGAEVQAALFAPGGPVSTHPGAGNLFYLKAMTSGWRRARYCLHVATIPTPEDWERLPLPAALAGLYYPLHGLRFLGRIGRGAGAYLRGAVPVRSARARTATASRPTVRA
jgi:hypothetical protein